MGSCNDGYINFDLINLVQGLDFKRPNNLWQNCLLFHLCKLLSYAVPCSSRKGHICIGIYWPEIRISSSLVTLKDKWIEMKINYTFSPNPNVITTDRLIHYKLWCKHIMLFHDISKKKYPSHAITSGQGVESDKQKQILTSCCLRTSQAWTHLVFPTL